MIAFVAQWEDINTTPKLAKVHHTVHIHEDKMYAIGGVNSAGEPVKDVWCLNLGNPIS